ncbi:MAG TPA: hypothetical protein VJN88_05760 [Ktedonobacterales bacterium]|nr:hypothetical protein [Ktedonobacterales bacterium]
MRRSRVYFLWLVLVVVLANYMAQVPYALHLYHKLPFDSGTLLLCATLLWFLCGFVGLMLWPRPGYWILLSFLLIEVGFYTYNMLNQVRHGFPPFFHLGNRDPILFTVFTIGYINQLAGLYFIYYLLRHRRALLTRRPSPQAPAA